MFIEKFVFDHNFGCYVVTPLDRYYPLAQLSSYKQMFDYYRIEQVVERLDFRKITPEISKTVFLILFLKLKNQEPVEETNLKTFFR